MQKLTTVGSLRWLPRTLHLARAMLHTLRLTILKKQVVMEGYSSKRRQGRALFTLQVIIFLVILLATQSVF